MKLFRNLFASTHRSSSDAPSHAERFTEGLDTDPHQSALLETRPYVVAMREVAADSFRSF